MSVTYTTARNIKRRLDKGLKKYTHAYLADKFGTTRALVSKIEKGWMPEPTQEEKVKFNLVMKKPKKYKAKIMRGNRLRYVLDEGDIWDYASQRFLDERYVDDAPEGGVDFSFGANDLTFRIYEDGTIWSYSSQSFAAIYVNPNGYHFFNRYPVSRLVLTYFKRPPKKGELARHLNGDPRVNHISNLDWGTYKDNADDMVNHNVKGKEKKHSNARMTEPQARMVVRKWEKTHHKYNSMRDFAKIAATKVGVTETSIYNLLTGATWKFIERKKIPAKNGNRRKGSADTLTDNQKRKIRAKFKTTKNSQNVFVANASARFDVSKYAIKKVIGVL